jgi:hypothetical protein
MRRLQISLTLENAGVDFYSIDARDLRTFSIFLVLSKTAGKKPQQSTFKPESLEKVGASFCAFIALSQWVFAFASGTKFRFRLRFHCRAAKQQNESAQPDDEQARCDFSCFLPRKEGFING